MARISHDQLRSLPSFSELTKWNVQFLQIPKGLKLPFDVSNFVNLRAESVTLPKRTNAKIETKIRGQRIFQNGLQDWDGSITLTFIETDDTAIRQLITGWMNLAQNPSSGKQVPKSQLEARIRIEMLNKSDKAIYAYVLVGCFIESDEQPTLDGGSSDLMKPSITISYDRAIPEKL